jgi:cytochrome c556
MQNIKSFLTIFAVSGTMLFVGTMQAQTPVPAGRSSAPGRGAAAAMQPQVHATLGQVMKGILFPSSNVIFAAQDQNPADVVPEKNASTATNPLASTYGKWEAVENSALAIAEAANLLIVPGRKCSNGRDVPIQNADWAKFVQGLRDAGMSTYKIAQKKNQDDILMATDVLSTACANCHDKYREKPTMADRCK